MTVRIMVGDARDMLATLPSGSVQCAVTSPPYYNLRDYGVIGQIGAEKTPEEYIETLVNVFKEVKRVLADDGTFWLNLGSSYSSKTIPSAEMRLRDDLSPQQVAYILREIASGID